MHGTWDQSLLASCIVVTEDDGEPQHWGEHERRECRKVGAPGWYRSSHRIPIPKATISIRNHCGLCDNRNHWGHDPLLHSQFPRPFPPDVYVFLRKANHSNVDDRLEPFSFSKSCIMFTFVIGGSQESGGSVRQIGRFTQCITVKNRTYGSRKCTKKWVPNTYCRYLQQATLSDCNRITSPFARSMHWMRFMDTGVDVTRERCTDGS
jgi:hypothetical protein